jgi:hypothetical protein
MNACLSQQAGSIDRHSPRVTALTRGLILLAAAVVAVMVSGCAVMWVANYDKESVDRSTEISKSVLKIYQDLMATDPGKRAAAMAGPLGARHGDVETQIRLHLLREHARAKNTESTTVAGNLLESWQKLTANHRSTDTSALSDAVLNIERGVLERHLRAAFIAEEAKKLGGGAAK